MFPISAYLFGGVAVFFVLVMAGGAIYIDRSSTARHEANALAKAIIVQRNSVAQVTTSSRIEMNKLKRVLAGVHKRSKTHRDLAERFETKLKNVQNAEKKRVDKESSMKKLANKESFMKKRVDEESFMKKSSPNICPPGCSPQWSP